jgi:hypothetical protein
MCHFLVHDWLKNIFDLYELYVTPYNFVPVLQNNQHRAA